MALKNGMFETYVKKRETTVVSTKTPDNSKYSHNRVFDEPESLKKALVNHILPTKSNGKALETAALPSSTSIFESTNSFKQTFDQDNIKIDPTWNTSDIINGNKKVNTNYTQTTHKPNTQTKHKLHTNLTQSEYNIDIKNTYQTQTTHKPNTKLNTIKTQTTHKPNTNQTQSEHISALIGVQRLILLFIFEECKKARSHITEPISIIHIASSLKIHSGSIKTSIARLCKKSFLIVNSFKNGRSGWSTYEIPNNVYNELLQIETRHKLHTNQAQTTHKVDTKLNTQPNTNVSSSSSNLIETTTTELNEEWNFDITSYARFGFTVSQLKQLASLRVISAAEVEQSLIEFSYDFNNNALPPIKTSKINFLMGLLRGGHSYVSESYRNSQEETIKIMAERTVQKRKLQLEEKFIIWESELSQEERQRIISTMPPNVMVLNNAHGIEHTDVKNWFLNYYLRK